MKFRVADETDIPALHALIESAFRGESARAGWTHEADLLGGQRTDVAALTAILSDEGQAMILAVEGSDVQGCVLVADKSEGRALLGMLTVAPTLQSAGIGRALVSEAEQLARAVIGARVMEMTVIKQRRELIDWYLRCGYADTGREEPFPLDDPRYGLPKTRELAFVVLAKTL